MGGHSSSRRQIISDLLGIDQLVRKPEFLKQVKKRALRYGYYFTGKDRVLRKIDAPIAIDLPVGDVPWSRSILEESLEALTIPLKPAGDVVDRYTQNGQKIYAWVEEMKKNFVSLPLHGKENFNLASLVLFDALDELLSNDQIGKRDFRRLFTDTLLLADRNEEFFTAFSQIISRRPRLAEMLFTKEEKFPRLDPPERRRHLPRLRGAHGAHLVRRAQRLEAKKPPFEDDRGDHGGDLAAPHRSVRLPQTHRLPSWKNLHR